MRSRTLLALLAAVALVLAGCTEEGRQDIVDALEDAASEAQEAVDEEPAEEEPEEQPTEDEPPAEEPTEEEPAVEEPTEEEPAVEEPAVEEGVDWLPWLLAALVLVLVVSGIAALVGRRRDATARRNRLRDAALAETDWLLGAARERTAGVDSAARARDVRLRLDRLTDVLQQVRSDAKPAVVTAADDLQTSARQLADALVARLDDVASGRGASRDLGVEELAVRVRSDRDTLSATLGRRPGS